MGKIGVLISSSFMFFLQIQDEDAVLFMQQKTTEEKFEFIIKIGYVPKPRELGRLLRTLSVSSTKTSILVHPSFQILSLLSSNLHLFNSPVKSNTTPKSSRGLPIFLRSGKVVKDARDPGREASLVKFLHKTLIFNS